jgi:hypothetical protein
MLSPSPQKIPGYVTVDGTTSFVTKFMNRGKTANQELA